MLVTSTGRHARNQSENNDRYHLAECAEKITDQVITERTFVHLKKAADHCPHSVIMFCDRLPPEIILVKKLTSTRPHYSRNRSCTHKLTLKGFLGFPAWPSRGNFVESDN